MKHQTVAVYQALKAAGIADVRLSPSEKSRILAEVASHFHVSQSTCERAAARVVLGAPPLQRRSDAGVPRALPEGAQALLREWHTAGLTTALTLTEVCRRLSEQYPDASRRVVGVFLVHLRQDTPAATAPKFSGAALRELRERSGLSHGQVARALGPGASEAYARRMEEGLVPNLNDACVLARLFGAPVGAFLLSEGIPPSSTVQNHGSSETCPGGPG